MMMMVMMAWIDFDPFQAWYDSEHGSSQFRIYSQVLPDLQPKVASQYICGHQKRPSLLDDVDDDGDDEDLDDEDNDLVFVAAW